MTFAKESLIELAGLAGCAVMESDGVVEVFGLDVSINATSWADAYEALAEQIQMTVEALP